MKLIIFLLLTISAYGQVQMTDPSGAKVKFYNEADVPTIVVGDSATFRLGKGIKYMPMVLWLEGLDTSKEHTITIYKNKPKAVKPPPLPAIVQTYFTDINTPSSKVTLGGTWTKAAKTATATWPDLFENDNVAFTYNVNDFVSYDFTGDSIQVIGERRENHGIVGVVLSKGTTVIDTASVDTYLNTKANQPSILYSSKRLQHGQYSIKVFFKKFSGATRNSIVLDGFKIYSTKQIAIVDEPIPPPPTGNIINATPSNALIAITTAATGTTIKLAAGAYSLPMITVPLGVNIQGSGASTILKCTNCQSSSLLNLTSTSKGNGNQTISDLTFDGANVSYSGITIDNRNGVKINNVYILNTNFTGIWAKNSDGLQITNSDFYNAAWSSNSYLSGAINVFNLTNYLIQGNKFRSDKNSKGTGIEALWHYPDNPNTLRNGKILNNTFRLSHHNPWSNGTSKNFSIEFNAVDVFGLEIAFNDFGNEVSLSYGRRGNGVDKTLIHDNFGNLGGDTYFTETMMDDLEMWNNNPENCSMFAVNFQSNSKWKNWIIKNNKMINPAPMPPWGGSILIGPLGVENVVLENNIFPLTGQPPKQYKFMGVTGGIIER
jgi:hypothetical protein